MSRVSVENGGKPNRSGVQAARTSAWLAAAKREWRELNGYGSRGRLKSGTVVPDFTVVEPAEVTEPDAEPDDPSE